MLSLINNGQSITPEHNKEEGNGRDSGYERYHRRRAEDSCEDSGEDSDVDGDEDSDEKTYISSEHGHGEYSQGNGINYLEERGKDLFGLHKEEMDMTLEGG